MRAIVTLRFISKCATMVSMKRIKRPGKTVRLPPSAEPMLKELRSKMQEAISVCGVPVKGAPRPSDGVVLAWSLALACTVSNPRLLVVDREVFLKRLEKTLAERLEAYEAATPEQKRAQLELLVAASADVSPYDTTAPLRAVPPEGESPS